MSSLPKSLFILGPRIKALFISGTCHSHGTTKQLFKLLEMPPDIPCIALVNVSAKRNSNESSIGHMI